MGTMKNSVVVKHFQNQDPNPKYNNSCWWESEHLKARDKVLLSWGQPLCYFLGTKNDQPMFLKAGETRRQGNGWGGGSGNHQWAIFDLPGPTVAFSALEAAHIPLEQLTTDNIIDFEEGSRTNVTKLANGTYVYEGNVEWTPPRQGMFMPWRETGNKGLDVRGSWHILESTLIRWSEHDYLCSLDEGRYFVSQLCQACTSVEDAFQSLKPWPVKSAEAAGKEVKRQGEWFFVHAYDKDEEVLGVAGIAFKSWLKEGSKQKSLPDASRPNGLHHVRYICMPDGRMFSTGVVYHRQVGGNPRRSWGRGGPEHAPLHLEGKWWATYRNTSMANWSVGGRFD